MSFTESQLLALLQQYAFPFIRIGGLMMVAPILGARHVPVRVRLMLTMALTILLAPLLPPAEPLTLFSAAWWQTLTQQLLIGIVLGFVLQIVFEAVMMGGELIAYSMGLGFAQLADPLRGSNSPVISQFLLVLASLIFLSLGGHLILLELVAGSFHSLPVAGPGLASEQFGALARFGGVLFVGGVQLALPVMVSLLIVNLAFGVMSRAAPTLNLIAVGFPAALVSGLLLLQLSLPVLNSVLDELLRQGWAFLGALIGAGG